MLSDCEKCWESPCICGWDFKEHSDKRMIGLFEGLMRYRTYENVKKIFKVAANKHLNKNNQNE